MSGDENPFAELLQDYVLECLPLAEQVTDTFVELERRWRNGDPADELLASLHERGVWMTHFGPRRLRAVTHLDIHDEGVERAGRTLAECVAREAQG